MLVVTLLDYKVDRFFLGVVRKGWVDVLDGLVIEAIKNSPG